MFIPSIHLPARRAILYRLDQPPVKHTVQAFLRGESPFLEPRWIVYIETDQRPHYMFMARMSAEAARAACENRLAIDPETLIISVETFGEAVRVPSDMIVRYRADWAVKRFGLSEEDQDRLDPVRRFAEFEERAVEEIAYQRSGRRSWRSRRDDAARQTSFTFVAIGAVPMGNAPAAAGAFRKETLLPSDVQPPPVCDSTATLSEDEIPF